MADINIQQKSSKALWWIIGIIALVLLLWFLFAWDWNETAVGALTPAGAPVAQLVVEATTTVMEGSA